VKRGYLVTSAWDGRAQALQRALALFAILAVVASLLIVNAANPPSVLGAPGDNTTTFSVVLSGSATAGSSVNVTVTAKDSRGRTVNSYPGGAQLSGLADSPSGASATYVQPTVWQNGSASASVTPVKSQTGAVLTATDTINGVTVSGNSAPFSVAPAGVDVLAFANAANSFNGQPVDAEFDTPIASSLGNTFVPVKVIALDQFGNRKGGVSVTMSAPSQLDGTKVVTTNSSAAFGTSPHGEAAFSNISITEFGNYRLTASASGASSVQSNQFEIVADLAKCTGTSCKSTGRSAGANLQITYSSVTGAATLNNVVLTTSFIGAATSAGCNGAGASFGQLTEARVQGSGITAAEPDFQMAVIVPKATLQALGLTSRAVDTFDLCVGATRLDGGTLGWFGRETIDGPIVRLSADSDGIFWGWAATCGTAGLDADSPCISLKTKNAGQLQAELGLSNSEFRALGFKSSDLGLVLEKQFPWDARVGMR
jgi:hypothetical protein